MNSQPAANDGGYIVTDPKIAHVCKQLGTAPEWMKDKFLRYLIRLSNDDRHLQPLIDLRDSGIISNQEFWRRM